jgi:hypothetical protein
MRLVERMARSHATLVGSIGGPADARQALISYEIGFREAVALATRGRRGDELHRSRPHGMPMSLPALWRMGRASRDGRRHPRQSHLQSLLERGTRGLPR